MGKSQPEQILDDAVDASRGYDGFSVCLGDLMRGERATMGKSLLDVERELKIKAVYISAIENADAEAFETPGFIPGYVRSYARYLGMDPDKTFTVFCNESGYVPSKTMVPSAAAARSTKPVSMKSARKAPNDDLFKVGTPFLPEEEGFLARLEPAALGSSVVLLALISLIGYGAWSVLNEVQKVNVTPADSTPAVLSDLDPVTGRVAAKTEEQGTSNFETAENTTSDRLDSLYRPQALDVPVLVSRDAPISTLDPAKVGTLPTFDANKTALAAQTPMTVQGPMQSAITVQSGGEPVMTALKQPGVQMGTPQVVEAAPPGVQVVAVRPAWVRIKSVNGTTLFEGIMNAGETFDVPETEQAPEMKVGESGAIYFAINGQLYGPAGDRGSVTTKIDLASDTLSERYAQVTELSDEDLSKYVAELNNPPRPVE